ncbi:hypothetical protein D9757_004893 [Collybiopsis confluens]|uniref:Uncharacterized protein n=1 Tax=Collybiopsis confluens TaxID=2823264 RepID=A0A8H5HT53_9AGAR|nr:hypothetical protein D9757_004893 [Collybiopsis confluens]
MSNVLNLLGAITPPPFVAPDSYDGMEFRWKFLAFRPHCQLFSTPPLNGSNASTIPQTFKRKHFYWALY